MLKKYPTLFKILSEKIRRKDGSYSERGLWDNIRDKRKRGEKPRKPGSSGAPTPEAFKKSQTNIDPRFEGNEKENFQDPAYRTGVFPLQMGFLKQK